MTKAEELKALDAFIQSLPEASYIRPWLESNRGKIANAMLADMSIDMTYQDWIDHRKWLVEEGKRIDANGLKVIRAEEALNAARVKLAGQAKALDDLARNIAGVAQAMVQSVPCVRDQIAEIRKGLA